MREWRRPVGVLKTPGYTPASGTVSEAGAPKESGACARSSPTRAEVKSARLSSRAPRGKAQSAQAAPAYAPRRRA